MIYIYAMNLNVDGVINPNLSLVQDIPAVHGMHLMNPNLKLGIESSGSFDFTVQPDDYFYDMFAQLKTIIRIDIDDENLFFGRVLTIETGFFGERKIACEGAISFLLDTYYPPVVEKNRTPISIYDYLMKVLDNHNAQCENDRIKAFNAGEIPGKYSAWVHEDQKIANEEYEFGASNWTQTKSVLDDLKSHYGGCWRTRFINNNLFLDWFDQYFTDQINDQKIEIGKNLITAGESTEVDNIFTRVIAVGKNDNKDIYLTGYSPSTITGESWTFSGNYFDVSDLTKVYTDQELSTGYHDVSDYRDSKTRYGLIWKIVSFDEANTQEKLFKAVTKWVKDNYHGTIEKIQVTAIDMNLIGEDISKIHIGDRVWLRFPYGKGTNPPIVERLLTCLEINYDLYNPENTSFSFGIPSMALTKNQRSSGKSTKQKASTPAPDPGNDPNNPENDFDEWLGGIKNWMKSHQVWYKHNIVDGKPKEGGPSLIIDSAGKSHKPYFWIYDIEMGDDGLSKVWIWHPRIGTVYNNGRNVTWVPDSKGRPIGDWVKTKGSDFTYSLINQLRLLDYIQYEYGINLQKDLSVKMPAVVADEDGNVDIFSNLFGSDGQGDTLLGKVVSFIADKTGLKADVLNVFNSDGLNVAKLLMEDGTYKFAALDENGDIVTDDDGNVIFLDNRQIYHATQELAYALEQIGVTVTLLDDQVTIIGQKVGDDTFGLVYDLAKMGIAVTTLTSEVNIIGDVVGDNTTGLVYDLAKMGVSVNALGNDVNIIGNKVGDETRGLVYDLAKMGITVSTLSNDVNIIGNVVGDNTTGLVYDLAKMGISVNALGNDVNIIGNKVGDETRGLVYDLAKMGITVSTLSNDVNIIGNVVGDNTTGLVYDLAKMGISVNALGNDVNIIGNKVGDNTRGLIYDLAKMGVTVSTLSNDVNIIGGKVGDDTQGLIYDLAKQGLSVTALTDDVTVVQGELVAAKARISSLETDYLKTSLLESAISNLEQVNVQRLYIDKVLTIKSGCQSITWNGTTSGDTLTINRSDVKGFIKNVDVNSTTGVLTFTNMDAKSALTISKSADNSTLTFKDADGHELSFSKAASTTKVSGSWSGGVLTVSADASGEDNYRRYFKVGTITWASDKKHAYVYGDVYKQSGQSEYKTDSDAFSLYVDTTASYNAGRNFYLYSAGWSSTGRLTIGAKDGATDDVISGRTIERTVTGGTPTWDGGTVTVPIRAYYGNNPPTYEDTNASITLNLSIDNDGNNSVKLKYGSTDTGYTFIHGKYTAGQKSVTPSISWPTGWTITASNPYDSTKTSSIGISMSHGSDSTGHYIELHSNETSSPLKAKKTIALDMGSVSSGSRTVKVKFDGSDILRSTINDYKNGQDSVHPTLSGLWSSGILTVSSSPSASDNYVRTLSQGTASWNGTTVSVPINATYGNSGQYSESTGKSVSVDVSGKLQSKSVTASAGTQTYTPDEGYVGLSSITVTASGGGDYSNVRTRFNATTGPSYYIEAYDQSTSNPIANTTINYKLGSVVTKDSDNKYILSAKVQIQNTSGTKISSTPEFSIPLHTSTVEPRASGTSYRPADGYIGLTKVTVNLSYSNWALELVSGTSYTYKATTRLNDPNAEYTNSKISSGNLSAKGAYDNGRNSVKVKAFTSDARTQLNDHRTFTYTTDASSPPSDAAQEDTWYLAGGSSWSSGKTNVYLRSGSASGTSYAVLEVGPPPAGTITNDTTLPSGASSSGTLSYGKYIKIGAGYYSADTYYKAPNDRSAGTITNDTTLPSGVSSSGTITRGKYIKIGSGYYSADKYYLAQNVSNGTATPNTSLPSGVTSSGTINRGSYIKIGAGYYSSDKYYLAQNVSDGTITKDTTLPSGTSSSGTITRGKYIKIGAGYYGADKYYLAQNVSNGTISPNTTLPSGASSSGTLSYGKYIKIGAGYYSADKYYKASDDRPAGTITINTSGGSSSGTLDYGKQIKIGAGYYSADKYYTAPADRWTDGRDYGWGTAVQKFSIPGPDYALGADRNWTSYSYPTATWNSSETAYFKIEASNGVARLTLRNGSVDGAEILEACRCSYSTASYSFSFVGAGRVANVSDITNQGYGAVYVPSTINVSTVKGGHGVYRYITFKVDGKKKALFFE